MPDIEGGCMCGKIRYKLTSTPIHQTNCHCADCRRAIGPQAVARVTVPREHLIIIQGSLKRFSSSLRAIPTFFSDCGTSITYTNQDRPNNVDITTGSLDKPEDFPSSKDIFPGERLPWVPPVTT